MGNPLPGQGKIPSLVGPGKIAADAGAAQIAGIPFNGGTVTLNGATPVVVANANVTANSIIMTTLKTAIDTVSPTCPNVLTITPGVGFTIGGVALDLSVYNYVILA